MPIFILHFAIYATYAIYAMSKFFLLLPRIGFGGSLNRYIFLYILSHLLSITEPITFHSRSHVVLSPNGHDYYAS